MSKVNFHGLGLRLVGESIWFLLDRRWSLLGRLGSKGRNLHLTAHGLELLSVCSPHFKMCSAESVCAVDVQGAFTINVLSGSP